MGQSICLGLLDGSDTGTPLGRHKANTGFFSGQETGAVLSPLAWNELLQTDLAC